jgi:hypothetical protein
MSQLEGTIVLPKKVSLGVAALIVGQVFYFGYSYATAQGRLERLERDAVRDTATIVDMRDRVVRIETQTGFIREAVDRLSKR